MFNLKKVLSIVLVGAVCATTIFSQKVYAFEGFTIPDKYYIGDNLNLISSTDEDYYEFIGKKLSEKKVDLVLLHFKEEYLEAEQDVEEVYYKYLNQMSIGQDLVLMVYYDSIQDLIIKDSGVLSQAEKTKLKTNFNKYIKDDRKGEGLEYLYKATAVKINEKNKLSIPEIEKIDGSSIYDKGFLISPEMITIVLIVITLMFGLRRRKEQ